MTAVVVSTTISDDGQVKMKGGVINPQFAIRNPQSSGFTVVELLSASLLTLCFFGWLTYVYVTVTRAALAWQAESAVAAMTQRAVATLTRDVERAVTLEGLSASGVTLYRTDGRTIIYQQRSDGVYRDEHLWSGGGVTLTTLQFTGLWAQNDAVSGQQVLREAPPTTPPTVPPAWLRVTVTGQGHERTYTAQTLVRLYCQRPMLLFPPVFPDP